MEDIKLNRRVLHKGKVLYLCFLKSCTKAKIDTFLPMSSNYCDDICIIIWMSLFRNTLYNLNTSIFSFSFLFVNVNSHFIWKNSVSNLVENSICGFTFYLKFQIYRKRISRYRPYAKNAWNVLQVMMSSLHKWLQVGKMRKWQKHLQTVLLLLKSMIPKVCLCFTLVI